MNYELGTEFNYDDLLDTVLENELLDYKEFGAFFPHHFIFQVFDVEHILVFIMGENEKMKLIYTNKI
jgi:hypothetical protein